MLICLLIETFDPHAILDLRRQAMSDEVKKAEKAFLAKIKYTEFKQVDSLPKKPGKFNAAKFRKAATELKEVIEKNDKRELTHQS